jgi:hypothetical protein
LHSPSHHRFEPEIVTDILCDFPSSGVFFFVFDRVLTWEKVEGSISFVKRGGEEG